MIMARSTACALTALLAMAMFASSAVAQTAPNDAVGTDALPVYSISTTEWSDDVPADPEATVVAVTSAGSCICDLTAGSCDGNCCCDPDCTSTEQGLFTARSDDTTSTVCLDEGPSPPALDFCVPKSAVSSVNLVSSSTLSVVTNQKASMSFLSQQLCIVDSNSAELGKYFTDPGHATTEALAAARTREIGRFFNPDPTAVAAATAAKTAAAASSQYRVNDTIAATGAPNNVFTLPGKTLSGVCGWTNVVGFGLDLPSGLESQSSECHVDLVNIDSTACTSGTLNSDNLVDNLRLAATKGSSPTYITPTVGTVKYRSRVGAYEQDVTAAGGVSHKDASWDAVNDVCNFAVAEAHWTITHDGAGSISAAAVDLVYVDAVQVGGTEYVTNANDVSFASPSVDPNSLLQKFSVKFVKTGETAVPKSGSPGYVVGAPLLAGYAVDDPAATSEKEAVSRLKDGLPIPAAGPDGRCGSNFNSPVRFGMSQSSSCAVPLTVSGLEAFCDGTGSSGTIDAYMNVIATTAAANGVAPTAGAPLPAQLMDGLLFATATNGLSLSAKTALVAGWADASYVNIADWRSCSATDETDCATEVTGLTAPTDGMTWNDDTKTCSNVPVGINIDVLTAKVGTMDNPQSRVSRVELSWVYGDWKYSDAFAAADVRQDFMLKSTVRFVEMDQASAEGVTPATPPIFPSLPADVFYPFLSAAPAGGRAGASAAWWVALFVAFIAAAATARQEYQ